MNIGYIQTMGYIARSKKFNKEAQEIINLQRPTIGEIVLKLLEESNHDMKVYDKKLSNYTYCEEEIMQEYVNKGIEVIGLQELIIPRRAYELYKKKYEV